MSGRLRLRLIHLSLAGVTSSASKGSAPFSRACATRTTATLRFPLSHATISAFRPYRSPAPTSAPRSTRHRVMRTLPPWAARWIGRMPAALGTRRIRIDKPIVYANRKISKNPSRFPANAHACRHVFPSSSGTNGSAPRSSRKRAVGRWSLPNASDAGVSPRRLRALTTEAATLAVASNKSRAVSKLPDAAAK